MPEHESTISKDIARRKLTLADAKKLPAMLETKRRPSRPRDLKRASTHRGFEFGPSKP